jgi:hypothetical protein
VQRLLRPTTGRWSSILRRHPLASALVVGVIPNAMTSALNITYNYHELIATEGDPTITALRREVFDRQLAVVNPLVYGVAIAVLIYFGWPVFRAATQRATGGAAAEAAPSWVRRRCFWLGDWVAWVSTSGWLVSGLMFPAWLQIAGAELNAEEALHFFTSQVLCGLMAATLAFFGVTWLTVTRMGPVLLDVRQADESTWEQLGRLAGRTTVYLGLSVAVFPLAMIAMPMLGTRMRMAAAVFGAVGLVSSGLAFAAWRSVRMGLVALQGAVQPDTGPGLGGQTTDSFWTGTR